MISQTFLRWAETANVPEREKAAGALARTFLRLTPADRQYRDAITAMIHLLDDPAASVRQAMAQVLAGSPHAPRGVVLALAEDQPDVACHVLTLSPVLTDHDLVDLSGRAGRLIRGLIAARPCLGAGAAAAIAEIGEIGEILVLLDNETAHLTRYSLSRIAVRHGRNGAVRGRLLCRDDLPSEARERLVRHVSEALSGSPLISNLIDPVRLAHVTRQAGDEATLMLADQASAEDLSRLVAHLRETGRLTPAFLMQALVGGRIDLFAAAITHLSGLSDGRVRALMATGRRHGMRALYESAGLGRDISPIFVDATLLWRNYASHPQGAREKGIFEALTQTVERHRDPLSPANALLDMVETMHHANRRQQTRAFAASLAA